MRNFLTTFTLIILIMFSSEAAAQGAIDNTSIGLTTPQAGEFTNLKAGILEATTSIKLGTETIINFSGIDDDKVKVSSGDTAGFLESKIVAGTGVTVTPGTNTITIAAPPVNVEDSADGVEITFSGLGEYDPGTGLVPALDLNGTGLVVGGVAPTVTVGGISSTVLDSSENPQQVIVRVPQGLNAGNY
jgi:hypothetical protein